MQAIIQPVERSILIKELQSGTFVRKTNKGNNEIHIFNHFNAPNLMNELGRVRELTFRHAGGGTGLPSDLDEFDLNDTPYEQLIVWSPDDNEIVGGYRFIDCIKAGIFPDGKYKLATTELFEFSTNFVQNYFPKTIELGRSFVQPNYQPSVDNRKGLFSLDNLWDGLGAIVVDNPHIEYFFGKVTMYRHFNIEARDRIMAFMNYFFEDKEQLVRPYKTLDIPITTDVSGFLNKIKGLEYKDAHKILNQEVRERNEHIPPLVNNYMNLSPTMKTFGTALNHHFGDVEETGIMVRIPDIYESKKERHLNTYQKK